MRNRRGRLPRLRELAIAGDVRGARPYLKSNPVRSVELPPEPVEFLPVLPSDKQLARPLDELPEPYRTMVWLVCVSGVRIGELLALRWRAVDWDRSCFWVAEAVDRNRFYSPQTHRSRRPILLADEDMKRLTEFRRRTGCAGEDDWLFLNSLGTGPIHADKALEKLQATAKTVGISYLTGIFFVTGIRQCSLTREFR